MREVKEKALELRHKYHFNIAMSMRSATQCAIIAVDEVIKTLKECETYKDVNPNLPIGYYQQVKQELENII